MCEIAITNQPHRQKCHIMNRFLTKEASRAFAAKSHEIANLCAIMSECVNYSPFPVA